MGRQDSTSPTDAFPLPPLRETSEGKPRRIGIELEMGGLDIDRLSELVAGCVGGSVEPLSRYEHAIHGDAAGDWMVELDFAYLKAKGRQAGDPDAPLADLSAAVEDLLRRGAEHIVPMEVVSPPLPMTRLPETAALVAALRDAGARGTTEGLAYAFGMQLNPEVPASDAQTIRAYLQAFLCLYDWLKSRARVDFTRRLTAYIDPFPTDYVRRIVDPGYAPALAGLIDDYLQANPTRNRALDLLPLFLHLDEVRVRAEVEDERVKPRPAFHYRLPNCEIDREDWGIHIAWADWLEVERLAVDPDRLRALSARFSEFLDKPVERLLEDWSEQVDAWLRERDH